MTIKKLAESLWYIGCIEPSLRVFAKENYTEFGVMHNSYIIETKDGLVLIGSMPRRCQHEWLRAIQTVSNSAIKWMILLGEEDDRSAVAFIANKYPGVILFGSFPALFHLSDAVPSGIEKVALCTHRTLWFGEKCLHFRVSAGISEKPTVQVIDQKEKILFTADVFGANYAFDDVLVSKMKNRASWLQSAAQYVQDRFASSKTEDINTQLEFLSDGQIEMICPARGPIADCFLEELTACFAPAVREKTAVPVLALAFMPGGFAEDLALQIAEGVQEVGGICVELLNLAEINRNTALEIVRNSDACLFGTPDIGGEPAKAIWDLVTSLKRDDCENKSAAVFCSVDHMGGAADNLIARLHMLHFNMHSNTFIVQGNAASAQLKKAKEFGFDFGCAMLHIPNPQKPKLVKCLVCGEVFDAALGICPVCGVGLDQCEPVDEEEITFQHNTELRYLILGGGVAAVSAADAIRKRDETGEILICASEPQLPYNRPLLSKDLQQAYMEDGTVLIHETQWYQDRNITIKTNCCCTGINTKQKVALFGDERSVLYDKLILATGAECFIPPIKGSKLPEVLTIRHLEDVAQLRELLPNAKKAVIIGGGVIGLEMANELIKCGVGVTVLEATSQIIGRQLGRRTAEQFKEIMGAFGVHVVEDVAIAEITGEDHVQSVRLDDGRTYPADFVIISCGNRANTAFLCDTPIKVEQAIIVDETMRTNISDIYACGDCAQLNGINFQLWQEASAQGAVAGANAAGEKIFFHNEELGLSMDGFGTSLFAIGDTGKDPAKEYRTIERNDSIGNKYETYWYCNGVLQGAALLGASDKAADVAKNVKNRLRYAEQQ